MEDNMKNGFFNLGKARYILGNNSVSQLRLPGPDRKVDAIALCETSEVEGDVMYKDYHVSFQPNVITVIQKEEEEEDIITKVSSDIKGLRLRHTDKVEEISPEETDDEKKKTVNRDPIRWFSAFPPQCLRDGQQHFKRSINLAAEVASLQNQLQAVDKEILLLQASS